MEFCKLRGQWPAILSMPLGMFYTASRQLLDSAARSIVSHLQARNVEADKSLWLRTGVSWSLRPAGLLQRAVDVGKFSVQIRSEAVNDCDDGERNARCDKAVFDGCGTRLVGHELTDNVLYFGHFIPAQCDCGFVPP
jgi:hypothetical protein